MHPGTGEGMEPMTMSRSDSISTPNLGVLIAVTHAGGVARIVGSVLGLSAAFAKKDKRLFCFLAGRVACETLDSTLSVVFLVELADPGVTLRCFGAEELVLFGVLDETSADAASCWTSIVTGG